ncbi:META domain-containing protein [Parapedobacter lycopersici]|uniref:META domain-containing protein n=1 Tax=Parapedobacter lycopersici TaxID=1864939 RepID=UPI003341C677
MKKGILIIALAVVAAACNNTNTAGTDTHSTAAVTETQETGENELFGKEWKLIALNGKAITLDTTFNKEPLLVFDQEKGSINGNGGCNNFMATFKLTDTGGMEISQGGATLMACPNLELEGQFFEGLKQVKNYRITGDTLFLDNEKKEAIATLAIK